MMMLLLSLVSEEPSSVIDLEIVPIPIKDGAHELSSARKLLIRGNVLYLLENRVHQVHKFALEPELTYQGLVADKGEGPGEVWLPGRIAAVPGTGLVISDNRGFSVFDSDDQFIRRFRKFTPDLSVAATEDRIYCLTIRLDQPNLIDVYDLEGTRLQSFFPKFLDVGSVSDNKRSRIFKEMYMFDGPLLTDEHHLYYFSDTMGRFFKMNLEGEVVMERDVHRDFGPRGMATINENEAYLADPKLMEDPGGLRRYHFSKDASHARGRLYLVRIHEPLPELADGTKEIYVYRAADLTLEKVMRFAMDKTERLYSFAVADDGANTRIYAVMDRNTQRGPMVVTLRP